MKNPIVSICVPTYKQIDFLNRCIDSILIQDYTDYELIISDDTPDHTIEEYLKNKLSAKNYSYFNHRPSLGSPKNWNFAISQAKGKFIKIMHHDDFFSDATSLSQMVERIENDGSDFLFCSSNVIYSKSNTERIQEVSDYQIKILKSNPEFLFFKNVIMGPSTTLYKNENTYFDNSLIWLVDVDYYIKQLRKNKFSYIQKPLISLVHNIDGQISDQVLYNRKIQISEHVLVFNKIFPNLKNLKSYKSFFDYLFYDFNVKSYNELIEIIPQASENRVFFESVINDLMKFRRLKFFKKRFYGSRYNNYIFKLEQFI
jgi:glycosyltransferase involved in cell wall biosynthesis